MGAGVASCATPQAGEAGGRLRLPFHLVHSVFDAVLQLFSGVLDVFMGTGVESIVDLFTEGFGFAFTSGEQDATGAGTKDDGGSEDGGSDILFHSNGLLERVRVVEVALWFPCRSYVQWRCHEPRKCSALSD